MVSVLFGFLYSFMVMLDVLFYISTERVYCGVKAVWWSYRINIGVMVKISVILNSIRFENHSSYTCTV